MHSFLSKRCLRWPEHVHCMDDGRILTEVLYGQLSTGVRKVRRPALRFMDACKGDLKAREVEPNIWEDAAC